MIVASRPLHVQVAEALGWTDIRMVQVAWGPGIGAVVWRWDGVLGGVGGTIPPYGADTPDGWACTGPLIKRMLAFDTTVALVFSQRGEETDATFDLALEEERPGAPIGGCESRTLTSVDVEEQSGPCRAIAQVALKLLADGRRL